MLRASASSAFSRISLSAESGRSTTSPAAMREAVSAASLRMGRVSGQPPWRGSPKHYRTLVRCVKAGALFAVWGAAKRIGERPALGAALGFAA
jgi:hypothetical protein